MNLLIGLIILLVVVGIIFYIVPMDGAVKALATKVLIVIVCVFLLIWVLSMFGLAPNLHIPR